MPSNWSTSPRCKARFDANGDLQDKTISVFQIKQDKSIPAEDMRQYHYIGVAPAA
jgi:hypothetical protein